MSWSQSGRKILSGPARDVVDVGRATPYVCELDEGDALFLPKNWHHAVISSAERARNVAVNTWYDLRGSTTPRSRVSALEDLFQSEAC